jgi:nucleoid DNA-binding protein
MSRADISALFDAVIEAMSKAIIDGHNIELRIFIFLSSKRRKAWEFAILIAFPTSLS